MTVPANVNPQALRALLEASQALAAGEQPDEVYRLVVKHATSLFEAEGVSVLLVDSNVDELVFRIVSGPGGPVIRGARLSTDQGVAGQVFRTGRAVRIDDVSQNQNFYPGIDAMTHLETRSLLAAPLIHRERTIGVIEVVNRRDGGVFRDADLDLLKLFANLAASVTSSAQRIDQAHRERLAWRGQMPTARMIGRSEAVRRLLNTCQKVARANTTVLLTGPTGSGKELAARAIHDASTRHDKPFIAVNCAAIPDALLESELFGHEKGAFTGAADRRLGKFELADGGTLFLDEIGEMARPAQSKLLRALQERQFTRVGGAEIVTCDLRVIAATNRDLRGEVDAGRFREDLYYRLNVVPVELPALADRREDIPLLVEHFLQEIAGEIKLPAPAISDDAMRALTRYPWPGNIRELRNVIERCILLCDGRIDLEDLPRQLQAPPPSSNSTSASVSSAATRSAAEDSFTPGHPDPSASPGATSTPTPESDAPATAGPRSDPRSVATTASTSTTHTETSSASDARRVAASDDPPRDAGLPSSEGLSVLEAQERDTILAALRRCRWNKSAAARELGLTRDRLRYRVKRYGLDR